MSASQITFHISIAGLLGAAAVGCSTALVRRHAQGVRKLIARGVQGVLTGLASRFFHERKVPC